MGVAVKERGVAMGLLEWGKVRWNRHHRPVGTLYKRVCGKARCVFLGDSIKEYIRMCGKKEKGMYCMDGIGNG